MELCVLPQVFSCFGWFREWLGKVVYQSTELLLYLRFVILYNTTLAIGQ